jgi:tetratricopeptide (TPR) repeat protein/predicted Ser/Thr protein kinase
MHRETEILFHELVDLSPDQRENYFRDRPVPADVRAEVEALLHFDLEPDHILTESVSSVAAQSLQTNAATDDGGRCGPYRLGRVLGRGGMGAVYLAERADGEVDQRVAIKVLRYGGDEPAFRDRFLRERQILASLSHQGIARLLDAGHTGDGQPYLVMEYIDGSPIDAYAEGLNPREKVALFIQVCDAVSYAHRNLIVHRDLKPSNILVDRGGRVKLLDFGIAKILDAGQEQTQTRERLLTPDYASPEQVRAGAQTTATDIYSLGAVLYKLLTGRSPHAPATETQEAVELAICSREPATPSRVNPEIPKDLDFILGKALRKEPDERYPSVDAFADDLRAFLEWRPVRARSGNAWYRTRKFVRRYRLPVAATALTLAGLSIGLYVANRERAIAQRRFLEVRQLANKLFDIDAQARQLPGSTKTRQLIVDTSLEYLRRLAVDVRGDPELALEVGNAYMQVARVQGVPISPNLGQMDQAEQNLRIADGFIHAALVSQPSNRTAILRAAQIAHDRMILARLNTHADEAQALARESAQWLERFHAEKSDKPEASAVLNTYLNVANQLMLEQQLDEALRLCRHAQDIAQSFDNQYFFGSFLWAEAQIFQRRGELDAALKTVRESVRLLDPGPGSTAQGQQTLNFVMALNWEGRILGEDNSVSLDRSEEAVARLERAFRIVDDLVHQDPNDQVSRSYLATSGVNLGEILRHSDARRALAFFDHTLRHLAEVKNNSSFRRFEVSALVGSSYPLRRLGRPAEARQRLDAALERLSQLKLYPRESVALNSEADETLCGLADHQAETGNVARALEVYQELLNKIGAGKSKAETSLLDAVDLAHIYAAMAALYRRDGQADAASALEARKLELWQRWDHKLPNNPFVMRQFAGTPAN